METHAERAADRPQLHMVHNLQLIPDEALPEGYNIRSLRPADLPSWAALLDRNGELGDWPVSRARPLFAPDSKMPLAGSFAATVRGELVATAQLHRHVGSDPYAPRPELGWVAVLPERRGLRLGYAVCAAVLRYARGAGEQSIFLKTDDFRLPAIRTYLKLGFEPWMYDESAPDRWTAVLTKLSIT